MTLDECIKLIMKETVGWVEKYEGSDIQLISNFPSVFLHYCTILRTVRDHNITYYNLNFLKSRFVDFTIENRKLKSLQLVYYSKDSEFLREKLNKEIKLYLDEWDMENYMETKYKYIENNLLIDLTNIEKINFKNY